MPVSTDTGISLLYTPFIRMRFARIFEFKTGQLLISLTTDSDVDGFVLSLETYHLGTFIRTGLPFSNYADAISSMDNLTDQKAETLYQSLVKVVDFPEHSSIRNSERAMVEGFENWLKNHSI